MSVSPKPMGPTQHNEWLVDPTFLGRKPDAICSVGSAIIYRWFDGEKRVSLRVSVAAVTGRHPHKPQFRAQMTGEPEASEEHILERLESRAVLQLSPGLAGQIAEAHRLKQQIDKIVQKAVKNGV